MLALRPFIIHGLLLTTTTVPVPGAKPVGPYSRRLLAWLAPLVQPKLADEAVRLPALRLVGAAHTSGAAGVVKLAGPLRVLLRPEVQVWVT